MDFAWKEVLPVVKVGEKHDPAEEEGDEHEEAVHHINQAVLQQNWVKRQLQGCNFLKSLILGDDVQRILEDCEGLVKVI